MKNRRWLGALLGFSIAFLLPLFVGESPFHIAQILFRSAFGSKEDFGLTLFYATPLIFTGLSVAVAFQAGLFNIGAEGQLLMAAAATTALGIYAPDLPPLLAPWFALLVALAAGALWGGFAGWLKAKRGSHEVIVTILLNFIAAGLTSWFVLNLVPSRESQNPESAMISKNYLLSWDPIARAFPDTGLSLAFPLALITAGMVWWVLRASVWGFEIKSVGQNPKAAQRAGISVSRRQVQSMMLAGALAGAVGFSEIIGHSGQFKIGFSPDYGFIGIAAALLAGNHPLGIIVSAFLMGALHKGASDLDLETTTITRDFSRILQALIILGVGLRLNGKFSLFKKRGAKK